MVRFEEMWLREEVCEQVVLNTWTSGTGSVTERLRSCLGTLDCWGINHFGNVSKRVKEKEKELGDVNKEERTEENEVEIKKVEGELDELLACEETWWSQRSWATWLDNGDKNTNFFYKKASQRRDRDWVDSIRDDAGVWYYEEEEIAKVVTCYFQDLFEVDNLTGTDEVINVIRGRINEDLRNVLEPSFSCEEVY